MSPECEVRVHFHSPPLPLRRYFTTFYLVEVAVPGAGRVTDCLHPEWGNLRFHQGGLPEADNERGARIAGSSFPVTGPSSQGVRFSIGTTRMWGVGLLPLGWTKFVPAPAGEFADALVDGHAHPAFAKFAPLAATIFGEAPDAAAELARIEAHFMARLDEPVPDEARILAIHAALVDPDTRTVGDLVARAGLTPRTLERACNRAFGFPPKALLRRQRFLRSLGDFMLDPSLKWIGAIDGQYHDQAQFVREFRQFMGLTPRQYAAMPKPILGAMVHARAAFAGKPVQALDGPDGGGAKI